jgi:hypothetical protein
MEVHKVQAMWQQIGNQRQGGECVFSSQLGGFAGGGAEKTPAGDYSINTLEGDWTSPQTDVTESCCDGPQLRTSRPDSDE